MKVNRETEVLPVASPAGPVSKVVVNALDGTDTINMLAHLRCENHAQRRD